MWYSKNTSHWSHVMKVHLIYCRHEITRANPRRKVKNVKTGFGRNIPRKIRGGTRKTLSAKNRNEANKDYKSEETKSKLEKQYQNPNSGTFLAPKKRPGNASGRQEQDFVRFLCMGCYAGDCEAKLVEKIHGKLEPE